MKQQIFYPLSISVMLLFVSLTPGNTQDADPSLWTVEDIVNQESAGDLEFSPDGNSLVWVKPVPTKRKTATSAIFTLHDWM